jgi:hypothetical protein
MGENRNISVRPFSSTVISATTDSSVIVTYRVIKIGTDHKKFGQSTILMLSYWPLIPRSSQHAHEKVRVIQTALTYSSARVNETRNAGTGCIYRCKRKRTNENVIYKEAES